MALLHYVFIFPFLALVSCRIYSIENPDGSYSIGLNSDSTGQSENTFVALLTKAGGYTLDGDFETPSSTQEDFNNKEPPIESRQGLLQPHLEILQLVETLLKFKGEVGARLYALISDNYEIFQSLYTTLVNKIGTLHSFTLTGIKILRRALEFAISLMAQWQISLPSVSLGLNLGNQNGASFQLSKNSNYRNKW